MVKNTQNQTNQQNNQQKFIFWASFMHEYSRTKQACYNIIWHWISTNNATESSKSISHHLTTCWSKTRPESVRINVKKNYMLETIYKSISKNITCILIGRFSEYWLLIDKMF